MKTHESVRLSYFTVYFWDLLDKLRLSGFRHLVENGAADLLPAFLLVFILQQNIKLYWLLNKF